MSVPHCRLNRVDIPAVIASVSAVVATAVSLFLLRQGQVDRREVRRDKEREQARQVTSWADWHSGSRFATLARPRLPAVFVSNSSDAAVYDVFVDFRAPVTGRLFRAAIGPIPPGESRVRSVDYDGDLIDGWEPAALHVRANFRDSDGKRWVRDPLGRLRQDLGSGSDGFFEEGGVLLDD